MVLIISKREWEKTGIVATLSLDIGKDRIAVWVDMDCLGSHETTKLSYAFLVPHLLHLCGHNEIKRSYLVPQLL